MSSVVISGDTSGAITLAAPAVSGTNTITLPAGTGTIAVQGVSTNIVSGTAVASTSGTSINFTGIPSWVKRITIMLSNVSTNGSSNTIIQIGSGSVETSGYAGSACSVNGIQSGYSTNMSAGFLLAYDQIAATTISGIAVLDLIGSNLWSYSSNIGRIDAAGVGWAGGSKTISGTLDRVRITTTNGTDAFDAGTINILYE